MFHVTFILVLLLTVQSLPLHFQNSHIEADISSSRSVTQFQMVIALKGAPGSIIDFETKALSPSHGKHKLKIRSDDILVEPQLRDQTIIFNYRFENQFLIGLSHKLPSENLHFLPVVLEHGQSKKQVYLPSFDWKLHQIEKNSIFKCHNTLVSIQIDRNDNALYLQFFTHDKEESIWHLEGHWQHEWRHMNEKVYFGGANRKDASSIVKMRLINGNYCYINLQQVKKTEGKFDSSKYLTLEQILRLAQQLKMYAQEQPQEL